MTQQGGAGGRWVWPLTLTNHLQSLYPGQYPAEWRAAVGDVDSPFSSTRQWLTFLNGVLGSVIPGGELGVMEYHTHTPDSLHFKSPPLSGGVSDTAISCLSYLQQTDMGDCHCTEPRASTLLRCHGGLGEGEWGSSSPRDRMSAALHLSATLRQARLRE